MFRVYWRYQKYRKLLTEFTTPILSLRAPVSLLSLRSDLSSRLYTTEAVWTAHVRGRNTRYLVRVVRSRLFKSYPNPPREKMNVILLDAIYLVFICCYNDVIATFLHICKHPDKTMSQFLFLQFWNIFLLHFWNFFLLRRLNDWSCVHTLTCYITDDIKNK